MLRICLAAFGFGLVVCAVKAALAQEATAPPTIAADAAVRAAVTDYLREVEEIERHAAEARAAAKQKLLDQLGRHSPAGAPKADSGLIGMATINGKLLHVSHDAAQRKETGADKAGEVVTADADPDTWPEAADRSQWHEQPLEESLPAAR